MYIHYFIGKSITDLKYIFVWFVLNIIKLIITFNYEGWDKENYLLADHSEYLGTKYKLFR